MFILSIFDLNYIYMNIVYLQLGSNIGDREQQLKNAIAKIKERLGNIINSSKVYESSPWRVDGQPNYLNQVIEIKTEMTANIVLAIALDIEDYLGRKRIEKWGERLIDIDIIFYNNEIIETAELCIPHKHMHERRFVLTPLNEIASNYLHPKYNKTVADLLLECNDIESVEEHAL